MLLTLEESFVRLAKTRDVAARFFKRVVVRLRLHRGRRDRRCGRGVFIRGSLLVAVQTKRVAPVVVCGGQLRLSVRRNKTRFELGNLSAKPRLRRRRVSGGAVGFPGVTVSPGGISKFRFELTSRRAFRRERVRRLGGIRRELLSQTAKLRAVPRAGVCALAFFELAHALLQPDVVAHRFFFTRRRGLCSLSCLLCLRGRARCDRMRRVSLRRRAFAEVSPLRRLGVSRRALRLGDLARLARRRGVS